MPKLFIKTAAFCAIASAGIIGLPVLAQDTRPSAAGDSFLTIPACAFNEEKENFDFIRISSLSFVTGAGSFFAPVDLPDGSVIKKIILICLDNGGFNISLQILRISQSGKFETITSVLSSGSEDSFRTFALTLTSKKYVNTWKHSHYLKLYLPGTASDGYKFSQAKIVYTPPSS